MSIPVACLTTHTAGVKRSVGDAVAQWLLTPNWLLTYAAEAEPPCEWEKIGARHYPPFAPVGIVIAWALLPVSVPLVLLHRSVQRLV